MREVGVLVPNLFLYPVVEAAIRAVDARPKRVEPGERNVPSVVIVDLGAVSPQEVLELAASGVQVLGFGPHTQSAEWHALRAAGAVVLPKSAFFRELPRLLASALGDR